MGLFDFLGKKESASGADKDLARLQKMVSNKLSQNLDREDALHRLSSMATPEAARVLLTRFNWTLDPSIKDQDEKAIAVAGIIKAGKPALEVIRKYCSRAEGLTWPLKAIRGIVSQEELELEFLELLDEFDTDYMRDPTPKVQLVQALGDFTSDEVRVAVQPFLLDLNEDVRFAAVTTVLGCKSEASVESLVSAVISEESLRIKNRILVGIVENGWKIPASLIEKLGPALPRGFTVTADGALVGKPAG